MSIRETMQAVMQAHQVVERFHKNLAELFRFFGQEMEESDPPFGPLLTGREILTSTISSSLRKSNQWKLLHFAQPLEPLVDGVAIYLLVNVSVDATYSVEPEVWLGTIHQLKILDPELEDEEDE